MIATDTARTRLSATWTELQSLLQRGEPIPYARRAQAFYEATLAHHSCTNAISDLLAVNGGRTMRADGALQRFFRSALVHSPDALSLSRAFSFRAAWASALSRKTALTR